MKNKKFYHISVDGDGSCLFHSMSGIIHLNDKLWNGITYKIEKENWNRKSILLRKKCIRWLKDNLDYEIKGLGMKLKDEIMDDVNNNDDIKKKSVQGYLKYMGKNGSYGGQIEIYALAELLKKNIRTYILRNNKLERFAGLGYEIDKKYDTITLYYNYGELGPGNDKLYHFEILYPREKAQIISKKEYMKRKRETSKTKRKKKVSRRKK